MVPLQEIEMILFQESEKSSLANPAHAESCQLPDYILKHIWLYPLGHAWGFVTKNGVVKPPLHSVYRGKNKGMQFFPEGRSGDNGRENHWRPGDNGIENHWRPGGIGRENHWRPAGYPEDFIDFISM
jgi:hypothetical protein